MKKIKTRWFVVFASLAAISLVVSATASAAAWTTEEGKPLKENTSFGLSGVLNWGYGTFGNIKCPVEGEATLSPGNQGELTALNFGTCETSGVLEGCELTKGSTELPWNIEAYNNKIFTGPVGWHWSFNNCYIENVSFSGDELTLTPDNTKAVSILSLSGVVKAETVFASAPTEVSGEFEVSPPGVFGISDEELTAPGLWLKHGYPLEKIQEVELDGHVSLLDLPSVGSDSKFECMAHSVVKLKPGGEGELSEFVFDPESCQGSGVFANCEMMRTQSFYEPQSVRARAEDVVIEFGVWTEFGGSECVLSDEEALMEEAQLVLTPDHRGAISSFDLSMTTDTIIPGVGSFSGQLYGSMDVTPSYVYGLRAAS